MSHLFDFDILETFLQSEPVAAYPQSQSELEMLRKRVVDLEEENRSIKQRLERIERFLWQQQQLQQARAHQQPTTGMFPPQTVIHQQRQSQRTLPDMPSKYVFVFILIYI